MLKQLVNHTKDAYQIACHFHKWWAKGPPLSTAQNRSTIMAKLYVHYIQLLGRRIGSEGRMGREEVKGGGEGGEGRMGREKRRGRGEGG